jgi:hypothetical protein
MATPGCGEQESTRPGQRVVSDSILLWSVRRTRLLETVMPDMLAVLQEMFAVPPRPTLDLSAVTFREHRRLIAAWSETAKHRGWIGHFARTASLYVFREEEPTLDGFLRYPHGGWALRGMADGLGLSEQEMWEATLDATAEAKRRPGWRVYQQTDWAARLALLRAEIEERHAKYPNQGRRWRPANDADLRERFTLLREQGRALPEGYDPNNPLLQELAGAVGRTPGAVRGRLVALGLIEPR